MMKIFLGTEGSRKKLIRRFRNLGFTGPPIWGRHQFMVKGEFKSKDTQSTWEWRYFRSITERNFAAGRNFKGKMGSKVALSSFSSNAPRMFHAMRIMHVLHERPVSLDSLRT